MDWATLATVAQVAVELVDSDSNEEVLNLLQSLSEEVITWPDQQQQERIKAGFLAKSVGKGPRSTIACVDGCNVEINTPSESAHSYFNRKKFPSLILQGICNHENRFTDVLIGFPGSAHDARVLREGPFFEEAARKCCNCYILGDSAYPLLPWLMQRFRRLHLVEAASIKQCCSIIMGACVLHNICNEERDFFEELRELPDPEEVGNDDDSGVVVDRSVEGYSECLRKAMAQKQC
ncbi:hypothetical protein HPB52_001880 [Rhipicephalus sanguineus]|uniref:DDE Tnp4 domain-containing protein n=1 Tax=Rhipicephalus sanguineus TaxID=34632 RepID=A0A9D4QBN8_RHISA|nr:hypothetical protein HPB52_001880 [Rhipicephalus sanguineus]